MTPLLLTLFLLPSIIQALPTPISGSVQLGPHPPIPATAGAIRVTVHSPDARLVESTPITPNGTFSLHLLPLQSDGPYILHLLGHPHLEYPPLLLLLQSSTVKSALPRPRPLLLVPDSPKQWPPDSDLIFRPTQPTNFAQRSQPWRWRNLWKYKIRVIQLAAVAFIVWFPTVIRDLPKELREDLMGEKEVDLGDTNAHFKNLLGRTDLFKSDTNPKSR